MFDFRYHVVSLAAVFIALVFGILIGVAISGRGVLEEAERSRLSGEIARLEGQLEAARMRAREQEAAVAFVQESYDAVIAARLADADVLIVFVGAHEGAGATRSAIVDAVTQAGGNPVRLRVLAMPVDADALEGALEGDEELAELAGADRLDDLGRRLGEELVAGEETPYWDALAGLLLVERSGRDTVPADAVVLARAPHEEELDEDTAAFLDGLYAGLAREVPAVAVERTGTTPSTVADFRRTSLSSVDNVDHAIGRVALALLLAGGPAGHYGFGEDADAVLPPVEPLDPAPPDDE